MWHSIMRMASEWYAWPLHLHPSSIAMSNVVSLWNNENFLAHQRRPIMAREQSVIVLPVICIERVLQRPARPRLTPAQRLKALRNSPEYTEK